jgi:hypothetical protein
VLRRVLPLALTGILLACGGSDVPAATDAPVDVAAPPAQQEQDRTVPATTAAGGVVADAPDALRFSAPLVGGGDIELTTLAGRPVLLWFWAPW